MSLAASPAPTADMTTSAEPPALADRSALRKWDLAYRAVYALYIIIGFAARSFGWIHGDAEWFVRAARRVLDGSFDLYGFRSVVDSAPPLGTSYSYSSFMALLIAPFVGVADALGLGEGWAERLMAIPLLFADVLAMHQLRRLVREWRPAVDERVVFLGVLMTLFLTGFWVVSAYGGHDEGLLLLFLLLSLRITPRNLLLGGLCAGLALSAKQTAIFQLLPVGLVLLVSRSTSPGESTNPSLRSPFMRAVAWGGVALGVFALFVLPGALSNPDAARYALLVQPTRLTTFGAGLPVWVDMAFKATLDQAGYAAAHRRVVEDSNLVLFGAVFLASAFAIWRARRRGQPIGLVDARLLALVAFGGVAQIVFGKWVTGHYYQLPLALVLIWDIVRTTPRPSPNGQVHIAIPWVGLGAPVVFRSITQLGVWWVKDGLVITLFVVLAVITLRGALGEDDGP